MKIIAKPTPNFQKGRTSYKPELIVIHIMEGTLLGTDSWFANPESRVSAHYGIGKNGEVHQYVNDTDTAWHAGRVDKPTFSLYKPGTNPNLYTLGIEQEGFSNYLWTKEMKDASAELIRELSKRWNIPIDRDHVIGHYQIYSVKANCPAVNKGIIDELIALANKDTEPPEDEEMVSLGKVPKSKKDKIMKFLLSV